MNGYLIATSREELSAMVLHRSSRNESALCKMRCWHSAAAAAVAVHKILSRRNKLDKWDIVSGEAG